METEEKSMALQNEPVKKRKKSVSQYACTWGIFGNGKYSRKMGMDLGEGGHMQ